MTKKKNKAIKNQIMLKFIIKSCFILLLITSCNSTKTKVSFLVTSSYLKNIDSIKMQTPYRVLNAGHGYRLSNLPTKLRNMRDSQTEQYTAWDEIDKNYKIESTVHIDTINKSEIRISRGVTKWLFKEDKRLEKQISLEDLKKLFIAEGVKFNDFKIIDEKVVEYDGGIKNRKIELLYKGTINEITIRRKGTISIDTYLISQIPYWESKGHQFSSTTTETIEKYAHKIKN